MTPLKISSQALAARSIKQELKKLFHETKFSVTSQSYANGDSIYVQWSGLPSTKEVNAVIKKYQHGDFNPIDDLYTYKFTPFHKEFGSSKYVLTIHRRSEINPNEDLEVK